MRRSACLVLGLGMCLLAASASAVELSYTWKKGDVHRFRYQDTTSMQMSMGGMGAMAGAAAALRVETEFSQKVLAVRPDGTAEVELTVEKLAVFQGEKKLASLKQIPMPARVVRAEVDRKGHARFLRMVTVYLRDDRVYMGIHKAEAGPGRAAVSASADTPEGGVSVDLVATIDPKTGKLTASASVEERPPELRKVKIREEDPAVDVLPKNLFEMMVLPDGALAPGQTVEVALPFVKLTVTLQEMAGAVAKLQLRTLAAAAAPVQVQGGDAAEADEGAEAGSEEEAMPDGMPGGMPGMGGMAGMGGLGMPGAAGAGAAGAGAGAPGEARVDMDTDVRTDFDTAAGRLLRMSGTLKTRMSVGGMGGMQTESRFELSRIE
jgi:hypothetical protein